MKTQPQLPLPPNELVPTSPMGLLTLALQNNAAIDVIERLTALQEKSLARRAEQDYNDALTECQREIPRIVPDLKNPQSNKNYSSYAALDAIIRPIYLNHGFSLSFSTADCPYPDKVRTVCRVSHGDHTQLYQIDITSDGSGPKGGGVMTKPHADLSANTLGMRRLLRMIFNIVDTAEDEMLTNGWLLERLEWIDSCKDQAELDRVFRSAFAEAKESKNGKAMLTIVQAKDKKKVSFQ